MTGAHRAVYGEQIDDLLTVDGDMAATQRSQTTASAASGKPAASASTAVVPFSSTQTGSLFAAVEIPEPYKKAVSLINSKPKDEVTLVQRKTLDVLIQKVRNSAPDERGYFSMALVDLRRLIGWDASRNYPLLIKSARALALLNYEWDVLSLRKSNDGVRFKTSALFPNIEITANEIRWQVNNELIDQVRHPETYAVLDMALVRRFRRGTSLTLYQFAARYERTGRTGPVPWETLRDIMTFTRAESTTARSEYKFWKRDTLLPSMAEIEAVTPFRLELVELRSRTRRVTEVSFILHRKLPRPTAELEPDDLPVVKELLAMRASNEEAARLISQYGRDRLISAITATKKRVAEKNKEPINSPVHYLRWQLRNAAAVVDAAPVTSRAAPPNKIDIRARYRQEQRQNAEAYFAELSHNEQLQRMSEYDAQQPVPSLRVGGGSKRRSVAAAEAFFFWLADRDFGEPTADQLLEFAERHMAAMS